MELASERFGWERFGWRAGHLSPSKPGASTFWLIHWVKGFKERKRLLDRFRSHGVRGHTGFSARLGVMGRIK